jgi:hypothetical protein
MTQLKLTRVVILLVATGLITGCGSSERSGLIGLVAVSGQVSLDGKPLPKATVLFIPTSKGKPMHDAGAQTDDEGKFELRAGEGSDSGALPGKYRVVISRLVMPDGSVIETNGEKSPMELTMEGAKESVPKTYSDLAFSKLSATIPDGGTTLNFALRSK